MPSTVDKVKTWSLEEISSLPLRLDQELYRHYPGMKLGQLPLIDFFSQHLSALALSILQDEHATTGSTGSYTDWVITAPAYYHLPSAANLLARRIRELLCAEGVELELFEPRLSQQQIAVSNMEEFKISNDYSKSQLAQRIIERQRVQDLSQSSAQISPMSMLTGRKLLIINDIYVTGTQQNFMQQQMDQHAVHTCHWLYIFQVEAQLASQHPEIEFEINNASVSGLPSFAAIIDDEQTIHTTRCISRLFSLKLNEFQALVRLLRKETREKLLAQVNIEGRYMHSIFSEHRQLLAKKDY